MQLHKEKKTLSETEFLSLIQQRQDSFYRVAYGYVRNPEDAKDIVQEAVCKAYIGNAKLKDPDKFYPWFYRILTNTAISFLHRVSPTIPWDPDLLQFQSNDEEEHWGNALWIHESLGQINTQSRTVIVLKIYEGMTFSEISQILNKSENTVKSLYYRGLRSLKERMQFNGT